jgi:hypothetical protein
LPISFLCLTVFAWSEHRYSLKKHVEILLILVSDHRGNFMYGFIRLYQQAFGFFDAALNQIIDGRIDQILLEEMGQVMRTDIKCIGDIP